MLSKVTIYIALAAVVLGFGYGQWQYERGHAAAEHERMVADLAEYKKAADTLLLASQSAQTAIDGISQTRNDFVREYNDAMLDYFDCYADDGRMRAIRDLYPSPVTGQSD